MRESPATRLIIQSRDLLEWALGSRGETVHLEADALHSAVRALVEENGYDASHSALVAAERKYEEALSLEAAGGPQRIVAQGIMEATAMLLPARKPAAGAALRRSLDLQANAEVDGQSLLHVEADALHHLLRAVAERCDVAVPLAELEYEAALRREIEGAAHEEVTRRILRATTHLAQSLA